MKKEKKKKQAEKSSRRSKQKKQAEETECHILVYVRYGVVGWWGGMGCMWYSGTRDVVLAYLID
jgi:hypothetical protein